MLTKLPRPTRRGWILLAVAGALLSSLAADAVASAGKIRAGVRVGTLELGGRSIERAERMLTERSRQLASNLALFRVGPQTLTLPPESVAFFPDVDRTLDRASRVGRDGNILVRVWQRVRSYFASSDIGWVSEIDDRAAKRVIANWAASLDDPGHEAGIRPTGGSLVPVEPQPGRSLDRATALATFVRSLESWPRQSLELPFDVKGRRTDARDAQGAATRANELVAASITIQAPDGQLELQPAELAEMLEAVPERKLGQWTLTVRFAPELVERHLAERMKPFEREPKDASFAVSGTTVTVRPSEDGLRFDAEKTAQALLSAAQQPAPRTTDAALSVKPPGLTTDGARALKITELVSTFTTNHPCCAARVKNIHIIADDVDGTIVRPGEEFSLNRVAGKRTTDRGYVSAPMIFDGDYKDEIGGGVSQFATTIYNAVFFGGYDFVSYKAHSYYISRYPPGREATVSWPAPDLKFRNNSESGILIKTSYSGTSISVSLYGTKHVSVTAEAGERTNFTEPTERREPDPALPPGKEVLKQKGSQGFDITVWRVMSFKDGRTKREKFSTRYKPEPRIITFGPGSPSPGPSPTPGPGDTPAPSTPQPPATPPPPPTQRP